MASEQACFSYTLAGGLGAPTNMVLTAVGGYTVLHASAGTLNSNSSGVTQAAGVITLGEGHHVWMGSFDMSFSTAAVGLTQVTAALHVNGTVSSVYLTAVEQSIAAQAQALSFNWMVPVSGTSTTVEVRVKVSADDTLSVYHAQFSGHQLLGYVAENQEVP